MPDYGKSNRAPATEAQARRCKKYSVESALTDLARDWQDRYPGGQFVWSICAQGDGGLVVSVTANERLTGETGDTYRVESGNNDLYADFIVGWWEIPSPTLFNTAEQLLSTQDRFTAALLRKIEIADRAIRAGESG